MNVILENSEIARNEVLRLETLDLYEVLQAEPDPAVSELAELAAKICNVPVVGIAFTTIERISVYVRCGIQVKELPLDSLPTIPLSERTSIYQIRDTRLHREFASDAIRIEGREFRFYTSTPLITHAGMYLGSLFVLDTLPRDLSAFQLQTLTVLARQAMASIELNRSLRQTASVARARQRVETALTVERNFVSTVLDTADALVVVFDTAGRIVRSNRACETVTGYDFSTLVGRHLWDEMIPSSEIATTRQHFERLYAEGFPVAFENKMHHRNGSLRRIAWSATPLFDESGKISFIIATGIDVTEQRAAEDTLRESEARYRQFVEGSLGLVCTHDLNGILLSVNAYGAQSMGYSQEEVVGRQFAEFMPEERRGCMGRYIEQMIQKREVQGLLYLQHIHGDVRIIAYRNKLIETSARPPYVLGFGIDISEQVRAEEQLRALMRQSNSVLESVGDGIFGTDLEGNCTVINPAALQMLGYKAEEVLGRNIHCLINHTRADGSLYPAGESPVQKTLRDRNTVRVSNEVFWRKDGTSFPVEYVARPQIEFEPEAPHRIEPNIQAEIPFETVPEAHSEVQPELDPAAAEPVGKAVGVVVAFTDTTERRALDRMKDEFISTVSHELRTPLTSLRAALGLVTGGSLDSRPKKLQQMLEIATANTDRLIRLVNDILELERIGSGKAELHCTLCSVDDLFRRAAGLQQAEAAKAQLRITVNAHGVNVWADPDRILQTLANLLSNAIKFSPEGTEIRLRARRVDAGEAEIQVRDEGRGIPSDKLETIFERFHQADASDSRTMGGTGLGLAICRSIVAQHGGRIWADSTQGKGATFHFTLPTRPASNLL
jgi:PAS domain S-box-containing protein